MKQLPEIQQTATAAEAAPAAATAEQATVVQALVRPEIGCRHL